MNGLGLDLGAVAQPDFSFGWGTTPLPLWGTAPLPFPLFFPPLSLLSLSSHYPSFSLGPYLLNCCKFCQRLRGPAAEQFLVHFEVKIAPLLTVALNNFWSWEPGRTVQQFSTCFRPFHVHCAEMSNKRTRVYTIMGQILMSFRRGPSPPGPPVGWVTV